MKKIGLLSDTHGFFDAKYFDFFADCDEVWHAGDIGTIDIAEQIAVFKPLKAVFGNIDGQEIRSSFPKHQRFRCEEVNVWMTHIGGYPGNYAYDIRTTLRSSPPDLFISGHSHLLKVMPDKKLKLLHINPGAAGINGFHKVRTVIRFSIEVSSIMDLEVMELPRR